MTTLSLDPAIQVRTRPDNSTSYILPNRDLGNLRWIGLIPLAFAPVGVGVFAFVVFNFVVPMVKAFAGANTPFYITGIPVLVVALIFCIPLFKARLGVKLFFLGIGLLSGKSHTEIRVDDDFLCDIEHAGPFSFTILRRKRADITTLRVGSAGIDSTAANPNPSSRYFSLQVLPSPNSKQKDFAPAYPRELLLTLAHALATHLDLASPIEILHAATPSPAPISVEAEALPRPSDIPTPQEVTPPPPQPTDSRATLLQTPDSTTLILPPTGFTGTLRASLGFSIVWNLFISIFIGVILFTDAPKTMLLFTVPFVAIGVGIFLFTFQAARAKTVFVATPSTLVFTQTGPLRSSESAWPTSSLASVHVGPSGTAVNDKPLLQLQIQPKSGAYKGVLTGRSTLELEWIAATLRTTLNCPPSGK